MTNELKQVRDALIQSAKEISAETIANNKKALATLDRLIAGPSGDVAAALSALFRLENDALSSRDGYGYSGGDAEIIRRIIMNFAELKESTISHPPQPDVNAELLEALKALLAAVKSSGTMNGSEYDALGIQVNNAIARAEQKGGKND